MRSYLIIAALVALAATTAGDPWKAPAEADHLKDPMASNPKAAVIGGKLFQSLCWTCHGLEGRGDGPNAAVLKVKPADLGSAPVQDQTNGALYWKITHGRGEMASYEQVLGREDRWALAHYIRTLKHP
ncbi:MAG TPA: cytochrome c [Flavobacteriales bacterium]|nr:cytochrome c [Flavobacteriales bacterium]